MVAARLPGPLYVAAVQWDDALATASTSRSFRTVPRVEATPVAAVLRYRLTAVGDPPGHLIEPG